MPKSRSFGCAVDGDEDVGRLEIAVHDEFAACAWATARHLQEQASRSVIEIRFPALLSMGTP